MEKTRWNVQANAIHQGFEFKFIKTEKMVNVYLMNQSFCVVDYKQKEPWQDNHRHAQYTKEMEINQ